MTLQLRQLALKSGDPAFRAYADRFTLYRLTPPVIAAMTSGIARAYPSVDDSPRAAVHVRARLSKISRVTLVVTDAAGATVAASRLGTHRRGLLKVRWNAHVRRRPAVPGDYQLWLSATDLAGNSSPRTPVGVAAVERDTEAPVVTPPARRPREREGARALGIDRQRQPPPPHQGHGRRTHGDAARPPSARAADALPLRPRSRVHRVDHRDRRERERRRVQAPPVVGVGLQSAGFIVGDDLKEEEPPP